MPPDVMILTPFFGGLKEAKTTICKGTYKKISIVRVEAAIVVAWPSVASLSEIKCEGCAKFRNNSRIFYRNFRKPK